MPSIDPDNIHLLEEYYARYREDAASVDDSWRHFFDGMEFGSTREATPGELRAWTLITAYRQHGHLLAKFNPIDPNPAESVPELELGIEAGEMLPTCGILPQEEAPAGEIIAHLRAIYCDRIGFETTGTQAEKWLKERIEADGGRPKLTIEEKRLALDMLNHSELFEIFLHTKYVGQKRFSLEGAEATIPLMRAMIEKGADLGMEEFVIGMAHRGRLNVLVNILGKPYANIFHEFEDTPDVDSFEGSGDVKYHKGYSSDITSQGGASVHLSLAANPSHLESVDPVVEGQVRAKQVSRGDDLEMKRVVPFLIHGDAALAGQGVIYETMQLYDLPGYATGGTLHLVINNQIGFTTLPKDSRSTRYCTDIAKSFGAPVFHVNGEDIEGCLYAAFLAAEVRQTFGIDVFIDLNCHRKYGHNEADEPAFTQPLEYQMIRERQSARVIYRDDLIAQGIVEREMAEALEVEFRAALQKELDEVQTLKTAPELPAAAPEWQAIREANRAANFFEPIDTAVPAERLKELAQAFCSVPEGFSLHRKVRRMVEERLKAMDGEINWGLAEHLAFASLVSEGKHVRLSGQDSRRGTFNHRHAMWVDQEKEGKFFPLNQCCTEGGRFDVFNSSLSEMAVLGFEYGYSLSYPSALVIWEAQFGDFSNGAQVITDQYITTSEQKWGRYSGLTLLQPHAYEGQGPEHSSGRIERFLQLAGDNNMVIANCTEPAQIFHLLRRQVLWPMRKPLVIFTPKSLLGHPKCVSKLDQLSQGSFQEILPDPQPPSSPSKLVLCSGHIYYDLIERRDESAVILRIEQLYPLHEAKLQEMMAPYANCELIWAQEEPRNMGAWEYVQGLLGREARYVGRERSASTATGSPRRHKEQLEEIMKGVFGA